MKRTPSTTFASARDWLAIIAGKLTRRAAQARKPGSGSAVPGLVADRISPAYLTRALSSFPEGLVVVSGTAGKSTTTKLLVAVLRAHGKSVFTNPSTANIRQGLISALVAGAKLSGRIPGDLAVLEMDEGHGAKVLQAVNVRLALFTNVLVDQVDRFTDPAMVVSYLDQIASRVTEHIVTNNDDAHAASLRGNRTLQVHPFGLSQQMFDEHGRELGYAAVADAPLPAGEGVQVVSLRGLDCDLTVDNVPVSITLPARGLHYAIDAAAAIAAAKALLGETFSLDTAAAAISSTESVFGRGERVYINGEPIDFVLVQNTASFELNVKSLDSDIEQFFFAVGEDVRDLGYFWPANIDAMPAATIVSGTKAHDAALLLHYAGVAVNEVNPNLNEALDKFLALPAPQTGVKTVMFTADCMRKTRSHLGLTKPTKRGRQ